MFQTGSTLLLGEECLNKVCRVPEEGEDKATLNMVLTAEGLLKQEQGEEGRDPRKVQTTEGLLTHLSTVDLPTVDLLSIKSTEINNNQTPKNKIIPKNPCIQSLLTSRTKCSSKHQNLNKMTIKNLSTKRRTKMKKLHTLTEMVRSTKNSKTRMAMISRIGTRMRGMIRIRIGVSSSSGISSSSGTSTSRIMIPTISMTGTKTRIMIIKTSLIPTKTTRINNKSIVRPSKTTTVLSNPTKTRKKGRRFCSTSPFSSDP